MPDADDLIYDFVMRVPGSERELAASGPAVLERMFELYTGTASVGFARTFPGISSAMGAERWVETLSVLAKAHPEPFMDLVTATPEAGPNGGRDNRMIAGMLSDLGSDRAMALVCDYLEDDEWGVRFNAARDLARHPQSPVARAGLEQALSDPEALVRLQAIFGIAKWDRARATRLLEDLLSDPNSGLTTAVRRDAMVTLDNLRADPSRSRRPRSARVPLRRDS